MKNTYNLEFDSLHIKNVMFNDKAQDLAPGLREFDKWTDIPKLSLITGVNGAGKSQLLSHIYNSIENCKSGFSKRVLYIPNTYSLTIGCPSRHGKFTHGDKDCVTNILDYFQHGSYTRSGEYGFDTTNPVIKKCIQDIEKDIKNNIITKEEISEKYVVNKVNSTHVISAEDFNLEDPIGTLGDIFEAFDRDTDAKKRLLFNIYNFKILYNFYLQSKASDSSDKVDMATFANLIENPSYINELIDQYMNYVVEESPVEQINRILEQHNFKYRIYWQSKPSEINRDYPSFVTANGDFPEYVKYDQLSAGEKMIITLFSWQYCCTNFVRIENEKDYLKRSNKIAIMLLDEPDAHLDPHLCRIFYKIVKEEFVERQNIQVVMTTHRLDTIALAPESSVYVMGSNTIKTDKQKAVSRMSNYIRQAVSNYDAMSSLSHGTLIAVPAEKYIFTEDEDDVKFYTIVYKKLLASSHLSSSNTKLFFVKTGVQLLKDETIEAFDNIVKTFKEMEISGENFSATVKKLEDSTKNLRQYSKTQGGGHTEVKKRINIGSYEHLNGKIDKRGVVEKGTNISSSTRGSEMIWGLVDKDMGRKAQGSLRTGGNAHSIENYLCMPLNLFYLIAQKSKETSLEEMKNNLETNPENNVQMVIDYVMAQLKPKISGLNFENTVSLELVCGIKVKIPSSFISMKGHQIQKMVSAALFDEAIVGTKKEKKELESALCATPSIFLPKELLDTMNDLVMHNMQGIEKNKNIGK